MVHKVGLKTIVARKHALKIIPNIQSKMLKVK